MPMSARKPRELHYRDKHRFADANLHQPILDEGDDEAASKISDRIAKDIGLSKAEIAALRKTEKKVRKSGK